MKDKDIHNSGTKIDEIEVKISYKIIELFSAGLYSSPNKAFEELICNSYHLPPPTDFVQWLENEWLSVNDLLRLDEVAVITGYALSAVQKWTYKKKLQCLWAQAKVLTTKEWLIEFFVSHGHHIIRKSNVHLRLLQKYYSK